MRHAGALALVLCGVVAFGAGQVGADGRVPESAAAARVQFPLWKDVPGESFAVLGKGVRRGTQWEAFASRASKAKSSKERPCVTVARFTKDGSYTNAGGCGPLAPENGLRNPPVFPLIGETGASFFAASFSHGVASVTIELGSGRIIEKTPPLLSRHQARKTRLPRFRFIAMSLPEDACIERVTGSDWMGTVILDSETGQC